MVVINCITWFASSLLKNWNITALVALVLIGHLMFLSLASMKCAAKAQNTFLEVFVSNPLNLPE